MDTAYSCATGIPLRWPRQEAPAATAARQRPTRGTLSAPRTLAPPIRPRTRFALHPEARLRGRPQPLAHLPRPGLRLRRRRWYLRRGAPALPVRHRSVRPARRRLLPARAMVREGSSAQRQFGVRSARADRSRFPAPVAAARCRKPRRRAPRPTTRRTKTPLMLADPAAELRTSQRSAGRRLTLWLRI